MFTQSTQTRNGRKGLGSRHDTSVSVFFFPGEISPFFDKEIEIFKFPNVNSTFSKSNKFIKIKIIKNLKKLLRMVKASLKSNP